MFRKRCPRMLTALATMAIANLTLSFEVLADTLESALGLAYRSNPQLNAQRALVRATGGSSGLVGYRPRISATARLAIVHKMLFYNGKVCVSLPMPRPGQSPALGSS